MVIHNIMEDIVYTEVNKLFDEATNSKEDWLTCNCMQCRLDTMCYVLNRVKPRYIKSGRGLAHFLKFEKDEKNQVIADITALAVDGMHRVLNTRRPHQLIQEAELKEGPVFNFPAINGRILHGSNFKPMDGVTVSLKLDGAIVPQISILWDNPYTISHKTPGTFTFCPQTISADSRGQRKKFIFLITAEKIGFETSSVSFELELEAEMEKKSPLNSSNFYKLRDLYLFDKTEEKEEF